MKPKPKNTPKPQRADARAGSLDRLVSCLSEERVLQLSNDMSEGITSGSVKDWRAVAKYFRDQVDRAYNDINSIRPSVAAMVIGMNCVNYSRQEMEAWLKRVRS